MRGEKQMNRKEKKAVGLLKALNNLEKKCKIEKVPYKSEIKKIMISLLPEDYGIFEILLNLIEKLQKENEELKFKERRRIIGKYGDTEIHDVINKTLSNDYISVKKIKDKIRHYQELQDNYIKKYDEINEGLQAMINVLQELLEGRK